MRRTLALALLLTALGTAGCGDDLPVRDITPDPTTPTTAVTTTTLGLGDTSVGDTSVATVVPGSDVVSVAPAGLPDVSDPILASYQAALDGLDSVLGTEATTAALGRLQAVTLAQAWSPEMLAGLFASFCNDWDSDDSAEGGVGPLTEQGRSAWAAAIVNPLHVSPVDARLAIEWALADPSFTPPCQ